MKISALSENFAGRKFRESGLSRNFLDLARIQFRESRKIMHFAGRGKKISIFAIREEWQKSISFFPFFGKENQNSAS